MSVGHSSFRSDAWLTCVLSGEGVIELSTWGKQGWKIKGPNGRLGLREG